VRVTALCPGVIRTAILVDAGVYGRVTREIPREAQLAEFERFRPMDPDRFAAVVLARLSKNPAIIVAPDWWKMVWWLNRLSPKLGDVLTSRTYRRIREKWALGRVAQDRG
jgi:hypothetical protein